MVLHDFCVGLCADEPSVQIVSRCGFLPIEIQERILNEFLIMTLSRKIHPIRDDDIWMGSQEGYRRFVRRNRTESGRAMNSAMFDVMRRVLSLSNSKMFCRPTTMSELVESQMNFTPSKKILSEITRYDCPRVSQASPSLPYTHHEPCLHNPR